MSAMITGDVEVTMHRVERIEYAGVRDRMYNGSGYYTAEIAIRHTGGQVLMLTLFSQDADGLLMRAPEKDTAND